MELTLDEVVLQSAICHPDWTVGMHRAYIAAEVWHLDTPTPAEVAVSLRKALVRTGRGEQV